jgi:dienelactone hydrolase
MNVQYRTVMYVIRSAALVLFGALLVGQVTPSHAQETVKPAADLSLPAWSKLTAPYSYNAGQKPVVKSEELPSDSAYILHVEFAGPDGEKVTGLYERPKKEGVYPCLLMLHGWTSKKEDMAQWIGSEILDQRMAFLALDAPKHGERKAADGKLDFAKMWRGITIEGIRDYRMAILWLADRKDVDAKHIGLLGYSMGAMMGSIFCGVDNRVQAAVLCVGGDLFRNSAATLPEATRTAAEAISPSLYIGHISPRPVLLLNGKMDKTVSEAASTALFKAAREPKQQMLFESGHILPKEALVTGVKWIAEKLR